MSSGRLARDHGSAATEVQIGGHGADRADGIEALAVYLIDHPDAGDVIPGLGGARKLRWQRRARGNAAVLGSWYVYVAASARIYLMRCYTKNVKTDLTADEKKQLRQVAAHLKVAQ